MVFKFHCVAKISVILVLFTIWLINFALPSLKEYQAEQIIVTTAEEKMNDILAPAVTVCAQDPGIEVEDLHKALQKYCANETDIRRCLDDATSSFSATILDARKGYTPDGQSLMDPSMWIPDITLPSAGKCYTLNTSMTLEEDFVTGTLRIDLKKDINYGIFIHDINYFGNSQNPYGIPVNFMVINPGGGGNKIYKMRTAKRKNIKNCNSDPYYKFTTCVRSSLSKTAGCRLPWDQWTNQAVAVCTTMEQFRYN